LLLAFVDSALVSCAFPTVFVPHCVERTLESVAKRLERFQSDRDPQQSGWDAATLGPLQLRIVGEKGVRTQQGEVRA
jgi:hypothetical protein